MKNKLTKEQQTKIVGQYTVHGVPMSSLKQMCRDAKISYPKLKKALYGQTMGVVNNEGMVYPGDIINFINGGYIWD